MTGPKQGEFWIVEADGKVTIGQCVDAKQWAFCGSGRTHRTDENFRAVRRLDIGALLDAPAKAATA